MLKIKDEGSNLDEIMDDIEGIKTGISRDVCFLFVNRVYGVLPTFSLCFTKKYKRIIIKCPSCSGFNIESLPIAENEKLTSRFYLNK
jgi:hypothetical protein